MIQLQKQKPDRIDSVRLYQVNGNWHLETDPPIMIGDNPILYVPFFPGLIDAFAGNFDRKTEFFIESQKVDTATFKQKMNEIALGRYGV